MKITSLGSWSPTPGHALRWSPTQRCSAIAAATTEFDGPVGFLAENHIRGSHVARRAGHPHTAYLGSGIELPGSPDTSALSRALESFVRRHPVLRLWFGISDQQVTGHLVDGADIEFMVSDDGVLDTPEDITDHLRNRFELEASAESFPGFAFGAIVAENSFALFLGCDHAISDGVSQALALEEIVELYHRHRRDDGLDDRDLDDHGLDDEGLNDEIDGNGGYLEYVALEAAITGAHLAGTPLSNAWQELFAGHDFQMPRFPLDLGLAPGESAPVAPFAVSILDSDELSAFETACAAAGGKFIDGVYAAVAITDHELGGADDYFAMTVLNTRAVAPKFATAQGWFCSFAPVEFGVAGVTCFSDLIAPAQSGRRRAKELGSVPTAAALTALAAAGATPEAVVTVPNMLSYIDFRWFPGQDRPEYRTAVMFTGEGRTANASMWINRDAEELYIGSQIPATPFAREQTQRYFRHLRGVFRDIARNGDRPIPGRTYEESDFADAVLVSGDVVDRED